jgi:molybdopterin-guanine dinucleotide biosynthesis protein B/molybdopterin-guanine dinucleotide biosynthesis protein
MTPCIAVVGPSGSGKTTLITQLIRILTARGYRVGAIKHTHHDFEIDRPGKDSFALKAAGAVKVALVSPHKLAFLSDLSSEPSLEELVALYFGDVDLVLAEGFKSANVPKILVRHGDGPTHSQPDEAERLADLLEARFLK